MSNITMKIEPSIKNKRAMNIAKKMGKRYTLLDAMMMGKRLGINWPKEKFTVGDLLVGMHYELEHGKVDPETNVTDDSPKATAKIAWAHLKERPDYYVQLMKMDPPKKPEKEEDEKKAFELLDELYKAAEEDDEDDDDDEKEHRKKGKKGCKTAFETLNDFFKEAAYLKDIQCEDCHYVGPPDPDGTCPVCGAIGGHKAVGLQKKYERSLEEVEKDLGGTADDAAREEQENIHSMMIGF